MKSNNREVFFNFIDTLSVYEKQTEIDRLINTCSRIKNNSISSYLDHDNLNHLRNEIKNKNDRKCEEQYNLALKYFHKGIILSNEYIDYKNKYYLPYKSDVEVKQMLDNIENEFNLSLSQLKLIENVSSYWKINIDHLYVLIDIGFKGLNDNKMKLEKYLNIAREYRKSLSLKKELKSYNEWPFI